MKKTILLLFLTFALCKSFVAFGQANTSAKPAEKPAFAYLLATSDLDVNITVLNNQNSYTVRTTDELVKIGLDAGDNIIKVTPLDGGKDGYTVTKTADKPGNIAFRADISARRLDLQMAAQLEEKSRLKMLEKERQGIFDYSFENIDKRTIWGEAPDKSIEYGLLPKGTPANLVEAQLYFRFGNEQSLKGKRLTNMLLADLMNRLNNEETGKKLDLLKSRIYFLDTWSMFGTFDYPLLVGIKSDRENIEQVIKIVSDLLKKPDFKEKDFLSIKEYMLDNLLRRQKDTIPIPRFILSDLRDKMTNLYPEDHPRYEWGINPDQKIKRLNNLTFEDIKSFYADFIGTSNASISVVGDFELNSVRETILKSLSGLKSLQNYSPVPEAACSDLVKDTTVFIHSIKERMSGKCIYWPVGIHKGDIDFNEFNYSIKILENRFKNLLNESSFYNFSYTFGLESCYFYADVFDCDSKTADGVLTIFKNEIFNLENNPVTIEELESFKTEYLEITTVKDDGRLNLGIIGRALADGRSYAKQIAEKAQLSTLTAKQVNAILEKYIKKYYFGTILLKNSN